MVRNHLEIKINPMDIYLTFKESGICLGSSIIIVKKSGD